MQIDSLIADGIGALARGIPVIGPLIAIVAGLVGVFLGSSDTGAISQAVNRLANETAQALDALKRFAWAIGRFALGAFLILWRVIQDMVGALVDAMKKLLEGLGKLYEDVIKPALRALKAIRKILDDVYTKWLRPIINALQQIRKILAIFRAFGFKWAAKLDTRIAQIEGKIIGPYIWLVRQLNGYGNWINLIITAGALIQKPIFRNSAYANAGFLSNLFWYGQTSGGLAGTPTPDATPAVYATLPQVQQQFQQYAQTGTGPLAAAAQQSLAAAQATAAGA